MIIQNNLSKDKVQIFLMMKFKVSPKDSLAVVEKWLANHPDKDSVSLEVFIKNNLVRVENNQLINLYDEHIMDLVKDLRGKNGIEIKDRKYRFAKYPKCFIGSELVTWIQEKYLLSELNAIKLGQQLIGLKIIHHVVDEHNLENGYLFYRFYMDELVNN